MKIAIDCGGFSPGDADQLRRAMATFQRNGTIGQYQDKMINGMIERGYERDFAERCFEQIKGFGDYGFPESHAASFALLVYASCWFKTFYPDVFCAAILNSQPMGFYAPAQLVRDAREHGVDDPAGRYQSLGMGLHAGALRVRSGEGRGASRRNARRDSDQICGPPRAKADQRDLRQERREVCAQSRVRVTSRFVMSGCAPVLISARSRSWRKPTRFAPLVLIVVRPFGR